MSCTYDDRRGLSSVIREFCVRWPDQAAVGGRLLSFLRENEDALLRTCVPGHFTGSALVANPTLDRVLLTHHRKLDRWLQLGGHADGDGDLARVAAREAAEESGLCELVFLAHPFLLADGGAPLPFDVDVHEIPARGTDPPHLHYDVRYVMIGRDDTPLVVSDESHDVRWFSLSDARAVTDEESMHRQFDRIVWLRGSLALGGC